MQHKMRTSATKASGGEPSVTPYLGVLLWARILVLRGSAPRPQPRIAAHAPHSQAQAVLNEVANAMLS